MPTVSFNPALPISTNPCRTSPQPSWAARTRVRSSSSPPPPSPPVDGARDGRSPRDGRMDLFPPPRGIGLGIYYYYFCWFVLRGGRGRRARRGRFWGFWHRRPPVGLYRFRRYLRGGVRLSGGPPRGPTSSPPSPPPRFPPCATF